MRAIEYMIKKVVLFLVCMNAVYGGATNARYAREVKKDAPKIAFLFLIVDHVFHEDYWKKFFVGHEDKYSLYVHAKHGIMKSGFFKPHLLPLFVPTRWEHTMNAQIELLRAALKDPLNRKFVFVSESTLPLQDFDDVYASFMSHPYSQFLTMKNPHLKPGVALFNVRRGIRGIPRKIQQKHTQWIMLNRKHARLLLENAQFLKESVYCDNEHYPGTILALHGCLKEIVQHDFTYVNWAKPGANGKVPFTFTNLFDDSQSILLKQAIGSGFLFARKFDENCNLIPLKLIFEQRVFPEIDSSLLDQ